MATHTTTVKSAGLKTKRPKNRVPTHPSKQDKPQNGRDRLLATLAAAPRLNAQDAARLNKAVQEAREASLGDDLSA